jgi:hypothetical protein
MLTDAMWNSRPRHLEFSLVFYSPVWLSEDQDDTAMYIIHAPFNRDESLQSLVGKLSNQTPILESDEQRRSRKYQPFLAVGQSDEFVSLCHWIVSELTSFFIRSMA